MNNEFPTEAQLGKEIAEKAPNMVPDICPCCNRDMMICFFEALEKSSAVIDTDLKKYLVGLFFEARKNKKKGSAFDNVECLR